MFFKTLPSLYWLCFLVLLIFVSLLIQKKQHCSNLVRLPFTKIPLIPWRLPGRLVSLDSSQRLLTNLTIFACGFFWALIYVNCITGWALDKNLEGKNLLVSGYIADIPIKKSHRINFTFKTETILGEKKKVKLKLGWYGEYPKINPGDKWQLQVRLKRPHGVLNPGSFDTEKHLLIKHIRATGYVVNGELNQHIESDKYSYPVSRFREFLIGKINIALTDELLAPIIVAFVTGDESSITKVQWQVLRNTGTNYLVAISGLHIGLIAGLIFVLIQFLWGFSGRLTLWLSGRDVGIVLGLVAGFIYSAIAGFSIPTQRALVMLMMFSFVALSRRYSQPWNAWLWSLFIVLIINPLSVLTIGFWLSFLAVAAIIYVSSNRVKQSNSKIQKFWRMQFAVTLTLLPFTLLFFQQFSIVSLVANLLAMPIVCFAIIPLSLVGVSILFLSVNFGSWILWSTTKLLSMVWWWLELLSNIPGSSWYHPIHNLWILAATCIAVLLLLAPRGFPVKYIGVIYLFPLIFYVPAKPEENNFWVTVLDVGQGLASVVQTANHTLIYDTGPKFFEQDAGATAVVPYLRIQGIRSIDMMVVSHGDADHSGGAKSILELFPSNIILTSNREKLLPYTAQNCSVGQSWRWDGISFQMLSPPINSNLSGNNASCVLKISAGVNSILLPGDIEKVSEKILVENHRDILKTTVLVAPHHGSGTSSNPALINSTNPQYVVFSAGYRNSFRFPHKNVVKRYTENGSILLNTALTGAITFKFSNKSDILSTDLYREKIRRFWHN